MLGVLARGALSGVGAALPAGDAAALSSTARRAAALVHRFPSGAVQQVSGPGTLRDLAARLCAAPPLSPEPGPDSGVAVETDSEEIIAGYADRLSLTDVRQLAHAVDTGHVIAIGYDAASGGHSVRSVSELALDPPWTRPGPALDPRVVPSSG
ncbi:hypothetical protein [Streptomyces sp. NPDC087270]|uniref:hypothetical protein n=1 Tax=Streptomyces sp. NPDC087270 TaxID=3365774 RepID=UPI00381E40F3